MLEVLLAFDPMVLVAFIAAGLLLNLTPGVDFVIITTSGIQGGPRVGAGAAIGVTLGGVVHVATAAAGLTALLLAAPGAYLAIKLVGAGYLLFLAWQSWTNTEDLGTASAAPSFGRAVRRGFLTNFLNPKTALFIFAFIPQFTNPEIGPIWMQILILGAIFLTNSLIVCLALGALAGMLADKLRAHMRALRKVTAILFGGLAVRLIID